MAVLGYTIFGRPVQHEFVSNGLFVEQDLNKESYLSDRISLQKGQNLAIFKRYRDNNGAEITTIFLNTYAISFNNRAGGFVGAGISFIGKPSVKLIYNRLKQLHQQSLSLVHRETFKFKSAKIDASKLSLPSLSEDNLFINRAPRKYKAKENSAIGIEITGNFYENLMGAIQGLVYNDEYFEVKTAYISSNKDLLKSLVPEKSIKQLHNLLDYSNALKKYKAYFANERKKLKEESDKVKKQIEDKKRKNFEELNIERQRIQDANHSLNEREKNVQELEGKREGLERDIGQYKFEGQKLLDLIAKLKNEKKTIETEKSRIEFDLRTIKQKAFEDIIEKSEFQENLDIFKDQVIQEYELENKKSGIDWFKVILLISTLLFFISSACLGYLLYTKDNTLNKIENEKTVLETNLKQRESKLTSLESNEYLSHFPEETSVNNFFKLETDEKKLRKEKLKEAINIVSKNKPASDDLRTKLLEKLKTRTWNFREILHENDPNKIMEGLDVLAKLKNHSNANKIDLLNPPLFLINDLRGKELKEKEIEIDSKSNGEMLLKEYLTSKNNIYKKLDIQFNIPQKGKTYQDSDPILLMHFRWMVYNYKDQKKDIYKLKKGDKFLVPVLK